MNDLYKLTRIILICLGVYVLINACMVLFMMLPQIIFDPFPMAFSWISSVLLPLCSICYSVLIAYLLLWKAGFWAQRIVGSQGLTESHPQVFWIPVAFRLASVFAGILYLYWVVPRIISTVRSYLAFTQHGVEGPHPTLDLFEVITWLILLTLGIYLLCGAPRFVRWQVTKTVEQCAQPPKGGKENTEDTAQEC